jgi:1,4-dihydroxy-2-naphthoyl-CoA hydrolase
VGLQITANHLKQVRKGKVIGTVRPVHLGRTTHVWDIIIENEAGEPVCVSRLTMAVMPVVQPE